tara:strand:- start:24 stop:284 length:261 start_codon:yes stop_codon:yes gene_type:complete
MASKNDITGDFIVNKPNSKQFEENFDRIFRGVPKPPNSIEILVSYSIDDKLNRVLDVEAMTYAFNSKMDCLAIDVDLYNKGAGNEI